VKLVASVGYMPAIPVPRRLRQEDHEFEASLGCIVRSCLKKKKKSEIGCCNVGSSKN
jgi:hypothetical protein